MKERLIMVAFLLVFWGMIATKVVRHHHQATAHEGKTGAPETAQAAR